MKELIENLSKGTAAFEEKVEKSRLEIIELIRSRLENLDGYLVKRSPDDIPCKNCDKESFFVVTISIRSTVIPQTAFSIIEKDFKENLPKSLIEESGREKRNFYHKRGETFIPTPVEYCDYKIFINLKEGTEINYLFSNTSINLSSNKHISDDEDGDHSQY